MTTEDELSPATVLSTRLWAAGSAEDEVESGLADRLSRVVESAVEVLGVDCVGLMLLDQDDTLRTAGFTASPASALEIRHPEPGLGPDLSEFADRTTDGRP